MACFLIIHMYCVQVCKVGHLLCRSRSPDFLLDILNRQGGTGGGGGSGSGHQSMPWLAELVEASEGSLGSLPVQCLCEFLLSCQAGRQEAEVAATEHGRTEEAKKRKERQLLMYLQVSPLCVRECV